MTNDRKNLRQFILACLTLTGFCSFTWASTAPTQAEIDESLARRISCNFEFMSNELSPKDQKVSSYLDERQARMTGQNGQTGRLDVTFNVKGIRFTRFESYAGVGGLVQNGYAPKATLVQLETLMRHYGWTFVPADGKQFQVPGSVLQALRMDMQNTTRVLILPGIYSLTAGETNPEAAGATVSCSLTSTSEADWQNKDGLPTSDQMLRLDQEGKPYPKGWIEPVIAKGSPSAKAAIVSRAELTDSQVHRLWQDEDLRYALISAKFSQLKMEHLEDLLVKGDSYKIEHLIARWSSQLPSAYVTKLQMNPKYARMLATASRNPEVLDDLKKALKSSDEIKIRQFMTLYKLYDDAVVDAIFTYGSEYWKREAADRRESKFTPAQIERALTDSNAEVQIWMLRRKDVEITRAQYDRGINHKDPRIAFWYQGRSAYIPASAQVDVGLTSPDESIRWSWANRKDIVLTPTQIEKLVNDPVLRVKYSVWNRPEYSPDEAAIDKCFAEMQGYAMRLCFSRDDFDAKPRWFELIVRNWNRNVIRAWREHPTFSQTIHESMLNDLALRADASLLQGLMDANDLIFNERQATSFPVNITPSVKQTYCKRIKATCQ